MTFKEFRNWCNRRACDGCWGLEEAKLCIKIGSEIQSQPFWKREKLWRKLNTEHAIVENIVVPTSIKIKEVYGDLL